MRKREEEKERENMKILNKYRRRKSKWWLENEENENIEMKMSKKIKRNNNNIMAKWRKSLSVMVTAYIFSGWNRRDETQVSRRRKWNEEKSDDMRCVRAAKK